MLTRLIAILVISLNFTKMSANPIEIHKSNELFVLPFQFFNNSDLLVYRGYNLNEDLQSGEVRKRRFLDDLIYLYNFFANYDDDDEDDSSSEEEDNSSNEKEDSKEKDFVSDLCRNCSVTVNKIQQIQHIQQNVAPSRAPVNSSFSTKTPLSDNQNSTTTIQQPIETQTPDNIEFVNEDVAIRGTAITPTETSLTITANSPTVAPTEAPVTTATNGPTDEVTTEATGTEETLDKTKVLTESTSESAVAEEATSEALAEDKTPAASETADTSETPVTTEPSDAAPVAEEGSSEALAEDKAPAEAETIGSSEAPTED